MKIIYFLTISLISLNLYSNEVEVIELHENKSLDQMVLEKVEETENIVNNSDDLEESVPVSVTDIDSDNNSGTTNNEIVIEQISKNNSSYILQMELSKLEDIFENSQNIKSKVLSEEFSMYLERINFDFELKEHRSIFYNIVKFFYNTGNISKAYELISSRDISNDENINFYFSIQLNYLLSTFQLEDACNLKDNISNTLKSDNNLFEKTDIFCSILENNPLQAELLNSIIIETEVVLDNNFQNLYEILLVKDDSIETDNFNFEDEIEINLIYLYSAMARIAEIPLTQNFLKVDSRNLAIPIILNPSNSIDLRIKAANESYINNLITIDSLAALYQTVDFNSQQLNNPKETIDSFSNNSEILMAYYYQLINIQIFPSERLQAIIEFWNFANNINLSKIAYSLSYKIIQTIEKDASNIEYSPQIAVSYIYNSDYENALKWIEFYENSNGLNDRSSYVRILLELYSTENIDNLYNVINQNLEFFNDLDIKKNEELIYTFLSMFENDKNFYLTNDLNEIYDSRFMPSLFIIKNIEQSIQNRNDEILLLYSIISLNNKNWDEVHPNFLELLIKGYYNYQEGKIIKKLILEIFKNYKLL